MHTHTCLLRHGGSNWHQFRQHPHPSPPRPAFEFKPLAGCLHRAPWALLPARQPRRRADSCDHVPGRAPGGGRLVQAPEPRGTAEGVFIYEVMSCSGSGPRGTAQAPRGGSIIEPSCSGPRTLRYGVTARIWPCQCLAGRRAASHLPFTPAPHTCPPHTRPPHLPFTPAGREPV